MEETTPNSLKNSQNNVVFLSGKMTGLIDLGRTQFHRYNKFFHSIGRKVIDPSCLPTDLPDKCYMPMCLAMLNQADEVFMIPGWELSEGARIENAYAAKCGKVITHISDYCRDYEEWLENEGSVLEMDF